MLPHEIERILKENAVKPAQNCKLCYLLPFLKNEWKTHILLSQCLKHNKSGITTVPKLLFQLDLTASHATKLHLSHSSVKTQQYFTERTMIFSEGFTWRAENDQLSSSEKSSFIKKLWLQSYSSSFSNESSTSYQHHKLSPWEFALRIRLTPALHFWYINSPSLGHQFLFVKSENYKDWQLKLIQQS